MQIDHPQVLRLAAFSDNYIWLIHHRGVAAVVDPGDAKVVSRALEHYQLRLSAILITHHHADHVGGLLELKSQSQATVYGPGNERIAGIDVPLQPGQTVQLDDLDWHFRVMAVPGHTLGHLALFGRPLGARPEPLLFCGDTLFAGGCGRLFEGTPEQMFHSLQTLAALPENTLVYCAHEYTESNLRFAYAALPSHPPIETRLRAVIEARQAQHATVPSTLAAEKATNPYLLAPDVERFAWLRAAKDNFRPGQALDPIDINP